MINRVDLARPHPTSKHSGGSADAKFDPLLMCRGMAGARLAVRAYTRDSGKHDPAFAGGKCPQEQATDVVD